MKRLSDESGWIRVVVCFIVLLTHHGLRDALLTGLPTLAASDVLTISTPISTPITPTAPITTSNSTYSTEDTENTLNTQTPTIPSRPSIFNENALTKTSHESRSENKVSKNNKGSTRTNFMLLGPPLFVLRSGESENNRKITSRRNNDANFIPENYLMRDETSEASNTDRTRYDAAFSGALINKLRRTANDGNVGFNSKVINGGDSGVSWWNVQDWLRRSGNDEEDDEGLDSVSLLKDDWSLVLEGLVLSSVYWGWIFTYLLADPIMDRAGVVLVMAVSLGSSGLLGLLTHAASKGGPWAMVGLRAVQGTVQGVCYPAVVRVLEGVPSSIRASAACLVFLGPCVGTSVGAVLGSLTPWYISLYVLGAVALLLGPLCLILPRPPLPTPHKDMCLKQVLSSRGVMACLGVHVANTWMLHTLLLGLSLCLIYTHMEDPITSGWVVSAVCLVVCVVVRLHVILASKLDGDRPLTVLNRRRIPVLTGTVLVCVGLIVMATVGFDSMDVLVGVGLGLGSVGVGVTRVGYRLNVDDMVPLQGWRVTKVLDVAALITAAISPIVLTALAQTGTDGWIAVWLVPLALLIPSAVVHLFLLTSNQQSWDQTATDQSNGVTENGPAANVPPVNGVIPPLPPLSVGRQSFKSARSALTFKTARSHSRTLTLSCRTIDDDLEVDMYSVANSNVDYHSVTDDAEKDCVSVASSSTFKSDGGDMHSVNDEGFDGVGAAGVRKQSGCDFGSILTHSGNTDRTSAWLSSHNYIAITNTPQEANTTTTNTRAQAHDNNAIYGLLW